jgi:hypothetical protein
LLPAGRASAGRSAAGSDSNNCANVATPCRHLAAAYAATAPNGEIYVLDPANASIDSCNLSLSVMSDRFAMVARCPLLLLLLRKRPNCYATITDATAVERDKA